MATSTLLREFRHSTPLVERSWHHARQGVVWSRRLTSIEPVPIANVEIILDEGRDDIGQSADEPDLLPPSSSEANEGTITDARYAARTWLAKVVRTLTNLAPKTAAFFARQIGRVELAPAQPDELLSRCGDISVIGSGTRACSRRNAEAALWRNWCGCQCGTSTTSFASKPGAASTSRALLAAAMPCSTAGQYVSLV